MSLSLRDGWDDDVDIDIDDEEDEDDDKVASPNVTSAAADKKKENNAWDEDDDLNFDDDDEDDEDSKNDHISREDEFDEDNGWNDDSLQFDDDDDDDVDTTTKKRSSSSPVVEYPTTTMRPTSRKHTRIYQELVSYILSLDHLSASINALLEAEYNNNADKAAELCAYYAERPGLVQYTIEKELPRMEYVLQEKDGGGGLFSSNVVTITDKQEIARRLSMIQQQPQHKNFLLPRCANQSMLADLLQVFTGPDLLVRPQYLATAIADACRFYLDLTRGQLQVQSHLILSLPTERGRWVVAQIFVSLLFVPSQPHVEYRLERVDLKSSPDTDPQWEQQLESALTVIESIHPEEEGEINYQGGVDFRDAFLQQSQNLLQNSAEGMQSALQEFEQVFGLRNKLNILPGFLPNHVLDAAAATEEPAISVLPQGRPTSILGGFVRKGFSRLAKQVALPEEDPALYQEWSNQQLQQQRVPEIQHQQLQPPPGPQLYNRQSGEPPAQAALNTHMHQGDSPQLQPGPQLCNRQSGAPAVQAPTSLQQNPMQQQQQQQQDDHHPSVASGQQHQEQQDAHSPQQHGNFEMPPLVRALSHDYSQEYMEEDQNGWGDEDDLDIGDDDDDGNDDNIGDNFGGGAPNPPIFIPPHHQGEPSNTNNAPQAAEVPKVKFLVDEQRIPDGWAYDPSTDILPTRRRWLNPHPGTRELKLIK